MIVNKQLPDETTSVNPKEEEMGVMYSSCPCSRDFGYSYTLTTEEQAAANEYRGEKTVLTRTLQQ